MKTIVRKIAKGYLHSNMVKFKWRNYLKAFYALLDLHSNMVKFKCICSELQVAAEPHLHSNMVKFKCHLLLSLYISSLLSTSFVDLIFIYYYFIIFSIKVKLFSHFPFIFPSFVDPLGFLLYQRSTKNYVII